MPDMEKSMSVLIVEPGKEPYAKEISPGLESLQREVGGYIEAVYPFEEPVAIVCNEEAKLQNLPLNRALRDEDGLIYDVLAGTFMVVGLTDEDFGSLSKEHEQQFKEFFKTPEKFVQIGSRIVAIPMISREQEKQNAAEQHDFKMNMDTSGLVVDSHVGTWYTIDSVEIDGQSFWLMEHEKFGDEAACIIVDDRGKLVLEDIYNGFDEDTVDLLRQEVMPVKKMPDESISVEDMKDYGYSWGGMLPMREDAALDVMKSCGVYKLYIDNTESMVRDADEIKEHAEKGGIFGVEKVDWIKALERENPLKNAEMSLEDDYGMIDGIINNGPKEEVTSGKEGKASIMERLKAAKDEPKAEKTMPHKEKKNEHEI